MKSGDISWWKNRRNLGFSKKLDHNKRWKVYIIFATKERFIKKGKVKKNGKEIDTFISWP
jgi:hypothetical protein